MTTPCPTRTLAAACSASDRDHFVRVFGVFDPQERWREVARFDVPSTCDGLRSIRFHVQSRRIDAPPFEQAPRGDLRPSPGGLPLRARVKFSREHALEGGEFLVDMQGIDVYARSCVISLEAPLGVEATASIATGKAPRMLADTVLNGVDAEVLDAAISVNVWSVGDALRPTGTVTTYGTAGPRAVPPLASRYWVLDDTAVSLLGGGQTLVASAPSHGPTGPATHVVTNTDAPIVWEVAP